MACLLLYAFIMIRIICILGCNAPLKQVSSSTFHCAIYVQLVSLVIPLYRVCGMGPTMLLGAASAPLDHYFILRIF